MKSGFSIQENFFNYSKYQIRILLTQVSSHSVYMNCVHVESQQSPMSGFEEALDSHFKISNK